MKTVSKKSVFINCPYDEAYAPLSDALIFTTVCCGYSPRSALETRTVTELRLYRILSALFESDYSLHDLSRIKGEGEEGYARLNMSLELGMAIARWHMTRGTEQQHEWLLLLPSGHHHHRFLSDLSGFDPAPHDGTAETLVPQVMLWLTGHQDAVPLLSDPVEVLEALPTFGLRRQELGAVWGKAVPWKRLIELAEEIASTL